MPEPTPDAPTAEARPDWLTDDVIAAVAHHMNTDHAEDNLVICRGVGGVPDATTAHFEGLDRHSATFVATTPDGTRTVRVPFAAPVTERAAIRAEVAALFHTSAAQLGLPPRN
jgi:hypothetical protein